jgi:transposase
LSAKSDIRRQFKATAQKGRKHRMLAEIEFRKEMAVILKIAGYTLDQIAASLGEGVPTVKKWFEDPNTQDRYEAMVKTLTRSAMELLQTYTIEAVQTIATVMRTSDNDRYIIEAAKEILDRGGLPRTTHQVSETTSVRHQETEITDTTLLEKLRKASPEVQEQAAIAIEQLENLLAENAESNGDGSTN